MFASVSPAPSRAPFSDTSKPTKLPGADRAREPHKDEDEFFRNVSSDDEDRKRRRTPVKTLVLDPSRMHRIPQLASRFLRKDLFRIQAGQRFDYGLDPARREAWRQFR